MIGFVDKKGKIHTTGFSAYAEDLKDIRFEPSKINPCPKCGKEYKKFKGDEIPKYCDDCKTRLWIK